MFRDNVVWVDFRVSKDIRAKQTLSFAERMSTLSRRTQSHLQASRSALETIKQMLANEPRLPERGDRS